MRDWFRKGVRMHHQYPHPRGSGVACVRTKGGGRQNACWGVQGVVVVGGGQKRPKNCVRTRWTAPIDVFFPPYDFKSAGLFWALSLFLNFQFNVVCSVFFRLLAPKAPFWLWKVLNSPPEAFKCMFFQANTVDKMASEVVCIFGLRKMCRIYKISEVGNINISRYSSSCRK